jgi:hypothetical protein
MTKMERSRSHNKIITIIIITTNRWHFGALSLPSTVYSVPRGLLHEEDSVKIQPQLLEEGRGAEQRFLCQLPMGDSERVKGNQLREGAPFTTPPCPVVTSQSSLKGSLLFCSRKNLRYKLELGANYRCWGLSQVLAWPRLPCETGLVTLTMANATSKSQTLKSKDALWLASMDSISPD